MADKRTIISSYQLGVFMHFVVGRGSCFATEPRCLPEKAMLKENSSESPYDYGSHWAEEASTADPRLKTARRFLYQKVELKFGQTVVKDTRLSHYLTYQAKRKHRGQAAKEHRLLREVLASEPNKWPKPKVTVMTPVIEQHALIDKIYYGFYWPIVASMWPCMAEKFEKIHGKLKENAHVLPTHIRLHPSYRRFVRDLEKRHRKRVKGRPYEVGRGKPPIATRFNAGESGNKEGCKKLTPLQVLDKQTSRKVEVTLADGSKEMIKGDVVALSQLFAEAMKGRASAQAELRHLIDELHQNGLLVSKKRRSRCDEPRFTGNALKNLAMTLLVPAIKNELLGYFKTAYGGPVSQFATHLEQSVQKISEIEGLNEIRAQHPKLDKIVNELERSSNVRKAMAALAPTVKPLSRKKKVSPTETRRNAVSPAIESRHKSPPSSLASSSRPSRKRRPSSP